MTAEFVLGCDFGASLRAGDQAKKTVAVEAFRRGPGDYAVEPTGRNTRLVSNAGHAVAWMRRRAGWTVPELTESLRIDPAVTVAAFDFPFGVPRDLLTDPEFAAAVGAEPFLSRARFVEFVAGRLPLAFDGPGAGGVMTGLRNFDGWKQSRFWVPRATDTALRAAPPLKNVPPNVFNMTLAGVVLVEHLRAVGYRHAVTADPVGDARDLVETYAAGASRVVGATRKSTPAEVVALGLAYLRCRGLNLALAEPVRRFVVDYRSAGDDPDGLDAFLCLLTAVAYREGFAEAITGGADPATVREEGVVILPRRGPGEPRASATGSSRRAARVG